MRRFGLAALALALFWSVLTAPPAAAVAVGSVTVSGPSTADVNTNIQLTIAFSCSGDETCTNVTISMSYTTLVGVGVQSFTIGDIQPGSTGQIFATAKFPSSAPHGAVGVATAVMDVGSGQNATSDKSIAANNPPPPTTTTTTTTSTSTTSTSSTSTTSTPPTTTTTTTPASTTSSTLGGPGTTSTTTSTTTTSTTTTTTAPPAANYGVDKNRSNSEVALGEAVDWMLRTWSWGNLDVSGLGWSDELPPQTVADSFYTGLWTPSTVTATFEYRVGGTWSVIGTVDGDDGVWYVLPSETSQVRATFNGGGAVPQTFNVYDPHRVRTTGSRPDRNGNWYTLPAIPNNCASWVSNNAGTRDDCASTRLIEPAARPAPDIWVETGNLKPTSEVSFLVRVANSWNAQVDFVDPFLAFHMPDELDYVGWEYVSGGPDPAITVLPDHGAAGRTLLRFDWSETLVPGGSRDVRVFATVGMGVPIGHYPIGVLSQTNTPTSNIECAGSQAADGADVDQDGDTAEQLCSLSRSVYVGEAVLTEAVMLVRGEPALDPLDWSTLQPPAQPCPDIGVYTFYPCVAQTKSLGQSDYRLEVFNAGNVALTDFTLYNTLPFVGDSGVTPVLSGFARGSEWRPSLQSPLVIVEAPPGVTIEYSSETNPCRNELGAGGTWPSGCIDDWGPPPPDLRLVQAIRIRGEFPAGNRWEGGVGIVVEYDMDASQGSPFGGEIGWTSFGYQVERADNGLELPASEPRKTGMVIKAPDNGVGSIVWLDEDRNGIRDPGELGINGVEVTLFRQDGSVEAVTFTDNLQGDPAQPGFYFFGDRSPGTYYVQFEAPRPGWNVMLPNQGNDDTVDSDASMSTLRTPLIVLGLDDFQLSWDLAYFAPLGPLDCDASGAVFDPTNTAADRREVNDRLQCPN